MVVSEQLIIDQSEEGFFLAGHDNFNGIVIVIDWIYFFMTVYNVH